jgi:gliding motility-associated-like protein
LKLARFILLFFLVPFVSYGQNITSINITDSINCYGDFECVDIDINNLNSSVSYDLWVWRDIGGGEFIQLTSIIEDFTLSSDFISTGLNSGILNYCFELNGDYTIEIINDAGGMVEAFWTTEIWPANTDVIQLASNTTLLCNGDSDGSLKVAGTGGVPPLTFSWTSTDGYSNIISDVVVSEIQNLEAGNYLLNLTDANGCLNNSFVGTIFEPNPIQASIIQNQLESCTDSADAQITAIPFGGNGAPYSFLWDNGDTTATTVTGAGTHSVFVQDSAGCLSATDFSITLDPIEELSYTVSTATPNCPGETANVTYSVSGGTGTIFYGWPSGTSTSSTNNLVSGDYSLVVFDQNSCFINTNFSITDPDSVGGTIFDVNDISCFGFFDGTVDLEFTGGNPNYSLQLFRDGISAPLEPDSDILDSITYTIFNLAEGSYSLIVSDIYGCDNTLNPLTFEINEPEDIILVDTAINNVLCYSQNNGSIITTITGGQGDLDYVWTNNSGDTIGFDSTISNLTVGTYNLNVSDSLCEKDFSFSITQPNPINLISTSVNNVSCFGADDGSIFNTVIIGGTTPYNYFWTDTSGVVYNEANPSFLSPSIYSLNVIDDNNCSSFLTNRTITEPNKIDLAPDEIFTPPSCYNLNDGYVEVSAVGGTGLYTYAVTDSIGTVYNTNVVTDLSWGNYNLLITDENDCEFDTSFYFENPADLEFTTTIVDLSCNEANDGAVYFDYTSTNPPYTISFNSQIVVDSVVDLAAGIYNSILTDSSGCQKTIVDTISQPSVIVFNSTINIPSCNDADLTDDNLISNGQILLDFSGGTGEYIVILEDDTTDAQEGITHYVNNLVSGTYDFEVIDSDGCNLLFDQNVFEPAPIMIFPSTIDVLTFGSNTGSIDISVSGGSNPYEFSWIGPDGFTSDNEDINNLYSGLYTLVVTDNNGCTDSQIIDVNEPSCAINIIPNIQLPDCSGENAVFNFAVTGGIAPYNCFMLGDIDNDGVNDTILPNTSITSSLSLPLTLPDNEYTLIVEGSSGCLKEYNLIVPEIETITVSPTLIDVSCFGLSDGQIIIDPLTDISGGTSPYEISWQGLDLSPVNPYNLSSGEYIVTISDSSSCTEVFYYNISEPSEIILADTILIHPNCEEGTNSTSSDGQITIIPQGGNTNGTGLYQYYWADITIPSIQSPENLAPGIYEVSVEDQTNCTSNPFFITLNSPELIEYNYYTSTEISCNDFCDGSFTVNTANLANETFNWYELGDSIVIGNSNSINNLCEGNYTFTIENNLGCYVQSQSLGIGNLTLTNPDEFEISVAYSTSVPFGICNGIASVTSVAGELPFTYNWSTGDTDLIIDSLCGGTFYSIEVTDNNDCISFDQFIINEEDCNFSIGTLDGIQPSCNDVQDGQFYSSAPFSGGFAPYNVKVYDGDFLLQEYFTNNNTLSFTSMGEGNYNIIVEESGGCLSMANFEIVNPSPLNYSYTVDGADCFAAYNPEAHITVTGGTPYDSSFAYDINFFGYEGFFSFEDGGIEQTLSGTSLQAGTYPLIVTDANGCNSPTTSAQIFTVEVEAIDSILVNVNTNDPICYGGSTGTASLSISGGVGPYEINWYEVGELSPLNDTIVNILLIDQLSDGDYYVSVKDSENCESITYFSLSNPSEITVSSSITPPSCEGTSDASISTNVSGGNGGYNYLWSPGGMNTNNVFNLSSGSYSMIVYDNLGCEKNENFEIIDPEDITISLSTTNVSCNGFNNGSVSVEVDLPVSEVGFQWYINGAAISSIDGGNSTSIVNLSPASYSVEVTNDEGCVFNETTSITEPSPLEIDLTINDPVCNNGNDGSIIAEVLGGTGSHIYQLSDSTFNVISNSYLSENLSAGDYTLSVTDENDCELTESFELAEPNAIIIQLNTIDPSCYLGSNGSATFTSLNTVGNVTQVWSSVIALGNYEALSFEDTLSELNAGNYLIELTDSLGCSQSEIFSISEPNQIEVDIIATPSECSNTSGASVQVTSNGALPVNYLWTINQGEVLTQSGNQATGLNPGTIILSGYDNNGCLIPLTEVEIPSSQNPLIEVQIIQTATNDCFGDSLASLETNLIYDDGTEVSGIVTYQWFENGVAIPASESGTISTLSNLGPGEYTVEVTDQTFGCINSTSITLESPAELLLDVVDIQNIDCYGDNVGSATASITNGTAPFTYQWNNTIDVNIPTDVSSPNVLAAGTYNLVVTDINNCQQSQSFEITQNDIISLEINSLEANCYDSSDGVLIVTNAIGGSSPLNYEWRNEDNEIVSTSSIVENIASQMYYLTAFDDLLCSFSDSIFLGEPEPIVVQDSIINISCYGENTGSISLDVSGGTGDYSYSWNDDLSNSNQVIGLTAGLYSVNIVDTNGCQLNSSFIVYEEDQIEAVSEGVFESCTEGFANISNITGGVSPYEVNWLGFPGLDTTTVDGLTPGYHTFIISDQNNCELVDSVLISGNNEINTNVLATNVLCSGNSDGSISIEITNDNHYPYFYSINDDTAFNDTILGSNFTIDNLPIGTYTIYIKDGEDCIDTTAAVSITQPEPLALTTEVSDVVCYGESNGMIYLSISGGTSNYEITTDSSASAIINTNGMDSLTVQSGTYEITVVDENNCTTSETVFVDEPNPLTFDVNAISDFNGYNLSCYDTEDGSISFNISGGAGNYELSYNDTTLSITDGQTIGSLSAGPYTFSLVDTNLCSIQLDTILIAPDTLSFDYTTSSDYNGFNVSCYGINDALLNTNSSGGVGPYDYSSNAGLSYEISNTVNEYAFTNLSSGEYTFVVRDENGCTQNLNYLFSTPEEVIPTLEVIGDINCNIANEGSLLAQVSGGIADFTYTLTSTFDTLIINSVENSVLIEDLIAGIYELNVIDVNGCQNSISLASQAVLSQPEAISYDINITNTSCNLNDDGSVEISNISGGNGPYSFKIYDSLDFYFEDDNLGIFDIISLDSLSSNSYTVIIIDNNNCDYIDTILIEQPEVLSVDSDFSNISCSGADDGSLSLSISGGTFPYNILINGAVFTTNDSITIDGLSNNSYDVEVVDELGCNYTNKIILSEPDSIQIESVFVDNLCYGQNYGSALFNVSGGIQPYSYLFTDIDGVFISDTNNINQLSAGVYVFTVTDSSNCSIYEEFVISQPDAILISNEVTDESCPNLSDGSILTSVSNFQLSYDIFWQNNSLSGAQNYNLSPGEYVVTVIDAYNCFSVDTVVINEANNLSYESTISSAECSYTNDGQLILNLNSVDNVTATLSNETYSNQISGLEEITFNDIPVGEYGLALNFNANCTFDTVITINSAEGYDCLSPEPTFSPNYDGINDEFSPLSTYADVVELIVFNRWGEKIYQDKTLNPSWDGTDFNGNIVPSADYYYIIKFNNAMYKDLTGIITLLK